jgi:hypothetical protein
MKKPKLTVLTTAVGFCPLTPPSWLLLRWIESGGRCCDARAFTGEPRHSELSHFSKVLQAGFLFGIVL